jgi:hypothetical protein
MFLVFVATVLAGSLGAIHYLVVHVLLGRPFAEVPPPVVRSGRIPAPGEDAEEGARDPEDGAEGRGPHG